MITENMTTENHGAHSGVRNESVEYNDGANIDINGGNDDYPERNFIKDAFSSGTGRKYSEIGKIAYGNNIEEEKASEDHVMTEDELVDQASMESFPASDPPGHISKSAVDQASHKAG